MNALLLMLRKRLMAAVLWQVLFVLAVIAIPITNWLTLKTAMGRLRFVAMDSRDTFYLTSAGSFEDEKQLHADAALMAAETIFDRNPDGYDAPLRLERLFNPQTTASLALDAEKDADNYKSQQIHQKFEHGQIREIGISDSQTLVSVQGQVLSTKIFNGRVINECKPVTVFVRLAVNGEMQTNGRYPMVVTKYEEIFEKGKS
jgi:hypothetical protein